MKATNFKKRLITAIVLCFLGLIGAVLAAHAIWSAVETHKLNQQIAALRAAGEPILPEDFKSDPNDNAALDLIAAAKMLKTNDPVWDQFGNVTLGLPLRPDEMKMIQAIVDRSKSSLDRLAIAKQHRLGYWPIDLSAGASLFDLVGKNLNTTRTLANVLAADALLQHQRGNDAAAITRINDIHFLADVTSYNPSLIGHLVATGCFALAAERCTELTPDLQIGTQNRGVSEQDTRALIASFLNDDAMRTAYIRGLRGERMLNLLLLRNMLAGHPVSTETNGQPPQGWNRLTSYVYTPIVFYNLQVILTDMGKNIQLADQPNLPAARKLLPGETQGPLLLFAKLLLPAYGRVIETHFRVMTDQHLAAVALAMRWYAIDHNGQFPPTLDALVPKYLPAIPTDPLTADSHPIRYLARSINPIIYSVGENGVDDGGSEDPSHPGSAVYAAPGDWASKDRTVHLTRQPRFIPPDESTQPTTVPIPN